MAKKKHDEGHVNHERWLLTYADLITLLMIFFVVMYSMSSINEQKFTAMAEQLSVQLGGGKDVLLGDGGSGVISGIENIVIAPNGQYGEGDGKGSSTGLKDSASTTSGVSINIGTGATAGETTGANTTGAGATAGENGAQTGANGTDGTAGTNAEKLQQIQSEIQQIISEAGLENQVSVTYEESGTIISLGDSLVFEKGSATINEKSKKILLDFSKVLKSTTNYIRIEGFTDNLPIHTNQFASNWELASQRAINVVKNLISNGVEPERISAVSFGEYRPSLPNNSEDNRGKNRRVDIVIINESYNALEQKQ